MKHILPSLIAFCFVAFLPAIAHAQVSNGVDQLHTVLNNVYNQMIPMCADLLDMCRALSGMGVLFYIGYRVWKHLARAEAIDFFPLFKPFVMVILISMYPQVLAVINGTLNPTVTATAKLVQHSNDAVNNLLLAEAMLISSDTTSVLIAPGAQGYKDGWDKYAQPGANDSGSDGDIWSAIGSGFRFFAGGMVSTFRFLSKYILSLILEVLYFAASLCIDTIRVFHLIVLAIFGPFVFAFSCYDGFQHSFTHWLARYVNIYLWLPIANLLGAILAKIQANMIQIDLDRLQSGSLALFSPTDIAYLIFLLIGIVGYFTVPGLSNYIVHTHGPNPISQMVNKVASMAVGAAVTAGTGAAAGGAGGAGASGGAGAAGGAGAGAQASGSTAGGDAQQYNRDKIAG